MRALRLLAAVLGLAACLPSHAQTSSPFAPLDPAELDRVLTRLASPAASAELPRLYAEGLAYAAHAQFDAQPQAAAEAVQKLEAAVHTLHGQTAGGAAAMAEARHRYELLGAKLPFIPLAQSLFAPGETARIDTDYGSATILLLFPDTCRECVEMAAGMRAVLFRLSERNVHLYGLMAQAIPAIAAPGAAPLPEEANLPAARLRGTPTLLVPATVLAQFGATAFPFAIATDSLGIIRFLGPVPAAGALSPQGVVDRLAAHVAQLWPPPAQSK